TLEGASSRPAAPFRPCGPLPQLSQCRSFRLLARNGFNIALLSLAQHENNNANAGHKKPRAKLTGAAGSHTSSTRRIRHCWLADIGLAAAFVRHNHAVSWASGDDPGWLIAPRVRPRHHGGAIGCGSHRTCFPAFHHDATLADYAAAAAWLSRYSCFEVS